ncbi:carbamoyltransferase C-terminal domain-containing protein [Pelagibius sp.]|uniref:carbamoyltransferase family protein n=1 Tax=Pelagibius sp. TaxID=1931238 RepID=UPI002631F4A1|nr:carbamoyltransferase C-terminal domain-containing protein [Pelagibius sp.]
MSAADHYLGIFEGHFDPAVAVVKDGKVIAYAEEERFLRNKHAYRIYPRRALHYCLEAAGIGPEDIAAIGINWNLDAYTDGRMAAFFAEMDAAWPLDPATKGWQRAMLGGFNRQAYEARHAREWRRAFGESALPPIVGLPHHFTHALQSYLQSPFEEAVCLTIDGSGDEHCTVVWRCEGDAIEPMREVRMPHSLGWFYAAFTEYLGFEAYDGEYKVMGLAAYGKPDPQLSETMAKILHPADDGIEYRLDPGFIHYGPRSWSDRFTDHLPELFGRLPRRADAPIEEWHRDLAFAVQAALEQAVEPLARWALKEAGTGNLCIGGGVGLNVKMNSRLQTLPEVDRVFAHPLCSDGGAAAGAALGACWQASGARPEPLRTLACGPETGDAEIEAVLSGCGLAYERPDDIAEAVAEALAGGAVVGWFQGRMEAGPRALGQRSILADPRKVEARDRVNAVIKYRENWRPFCPSILAEAAERYLVGGQDAPFMIIAFEASEEFKRAAPAVVHVDGTARVQVVHREVLPLYHRLISRFEAHTGVAAVLNTSFNVKGEPIVCTIHDALRTFFSTGMDVLAAGSFLVRKPKEQLSHE